MSKPDSLDETFALYFNDYKEDNHKRETVDGVQTLTITNLDAYNARIAKEHARSERERLEQDARIAAYEQHQIDHDER